MKTLKDKLPEKTIQQRLKDYITKVAQSLNDYTLIELNRSGVM